METELNSSEQQEFYQIFELFKLDDNTKTLGEKLFADFRKKTPNQQPDQMVLGVYSAILAASKSQPYLPEQTASAMTNTLSINQVIKAINSYAKKPFNTQEFLTVLKQFISQVPLPIQSATKLKEVINRFALSLTLYVKYQDLLRQLGFKDKTNETSNYVTCLANMGWLLFLETKNTIQKGQIGLVDSVFLLLAILAHLIYFMKDNIESSYFEQKKINIYDKETNKKNQEVILKTVLGLLPLNNPGIENLTPFSQGIEDTLKKLLDKQVVVSDKEDSFEGVYSSQLLYSNLDKLEEHYHKQLTEDDIDERLFRDQKKLFLGKLTPFSKQGSNNKLNINVNVTSEDPEYTHTPQKENYFYKSLNYQTTEQLSLGSNIRDIRNANQMIPPSPQPNLASATPMSRALEMYKWLNEKLKFRKNEAGLPPTLDKYFSIVGEKQKEDILNLLNSILDTEKENAVLASNAKIPTQLKDKHHQIMNLYYKILEELLIQEEKKTTRPQYQEILRNENFHKALIACSIEVVFFINNYSDLSFQSLLELCQIPAFAFWRIIPSFNRFDPKMPTPLKKHFYELELRILMHIAWQKDSNILKLINKITEHSKQELKVKKEAEASQNNSGQSSTTPFEHDPKNENTNLTNLPSENSNEIPGVPKMEVESEPNYSELNHSELLFFKRVLHHTAVQTYQICEQLNLNDTMIEHVWSTIQHVLGFQTSLLIGRHVAQLLLCSVYGVCKVFRQNLKFSEIMTKYQKLPMFNKDEYTMIFHRVYVEEDQYTDLISFYNKVFIGPMKDFLYSLPSKSSTSNKSAVAPSPKPKVPLLVTHSPLREFLPQQLKPPGMQTPDPKTPYKYTPRTKALYAFGESPGGVLDAINKVSKRQIDFADGADVGDTTRKQVKTPNSIFEKIFEGTPGREQESTANKTTSKRNLFGRAPSEGSNSNSNTNKSFSGEDSRSLPLMARDSSNSNSLSLPIPQDPKDRTISSSMGSLIDKSNFDSEESQNILLEKEKGKQTEKVNK